MKMYSSLMVICCFAMSEQSCLCGSWYTQDIVCDSKIVVKAKIESFSMNDYYKNYQISETKIYKGKGTYDTLTDKTTLETPISYMACGPVDLKVGSSYILTASIHNGKMEISSCDLKVEASKASNTMLEGLAGKYEENCDCKTPNEFDQQIVLWRTNKQHCGYPHCNDNDDLVCARDDNDCKDQGCTGTDSV
ncbi:metalloproteinase inhibitor 2-like [Mytilus trossulus]|uniref:metalloproteinase inhibitor 2-like n=1 Tax=Mytilus trossulus TaxID=6551 RepID=UPI003005F4DB